MKRFSRAIIALVGATLLVACAQHKPEPAPSATSAAQASLENGQLIFQMGRDRDGRTIHAASPPLYENCAACHRPTGAGGVHLPGGAVSADLRYKALVTTQHPPYTLRTLERAISTGMDNTGAPLNPVMPRWRLSARDLHDVAYYVLHRLK